MLIIFEILQVVLKHFHPCGIVSRFTFYLQLEILFVANKVDLPMRFWGKISSNSKPKFQTHLFAQKVGL
ncbi:hypothetical protein OUZ56_001327 [Daphnia magna]|uniref:Uncharacterized protein n=1 Tax=Daphnia magna TaxID=35525 RepID=A0ABR0A2F8_9CRUS|nr:hypothetical protein OUZ56_001327 [Daphnia magna]